MCSVDISQIIREEIHVSILYNNTLASLHDTVIKLGFVLT